MSGPSHSCFAPLVSGTLDMLAKRFFLEYCLCSKVLQSSMVAEMSFAALLSLTAFIAVLAMIVPSSVGVPDCPTVAC